MEPVLLRVLFQRSAGQDVKWRHDIELAQCLRKNPSRAQQHMIDTKYAPLCVSDVREIPRHYPPYAVGACAITIDEGDDAAVRAVFAECIERWGNVFGASWPTKPKHREEPVLHGQGRRQREGGPQRGVRDVYKYGTFASGRFVHNRKRDAKRAAHTALASD